MSAPAPSRGRRFLHTIGTGYVVQIVVTGVGLLLTPLQLDLLGAAGYGLWAQAQQLLVYLGLLDIGVIALLPRQLAYASGRAGGAGAVREELERVAGLLRWQLPVIAVVAVVVLLALPSSWDPLRGPLWFVLATYVVVYPLRLFHGALEGLQDGASIGRSQLAGWACASLCGTLLLLAGFGLWGMAIGWSLGQLVSSAGWLWRVWRHHRAVVPHALPRTDWRFARGLFASGAWMSVAQVAHVLLSGTELLLVGYVFGPVAVATYGVTAKLVLVLQNQPQLLMHAGMPSLSQARAAGDRAAQRRIATVLTQLLLLASGAVAVGVVVVNGSFVRSWVGPERYGGNALTIALVGNMLLRHLNVTASYTTFCFGHERRNALVSIADGVATVALTLLLLPRLGLVGAPIASMVCVAAISIPANVRLIARELGLGTAEYVRGLQGWALVCAAMLGAAVATNHLLAGRPLVLVIIVGGALVLVYGMLAATQLVRSPSGVYVLERIPPSGRRFVQPFLREA